MEGRQKPVALPLVFFSREVLCQKLIGIIPEVGMASSQSERMKVIANHFH
jgi:hypothetical protein